MRFVRRILDGARGEVIEHGSRKVFRLFKNPMEFEDLPFREADFTEDYPERMLNPMQVAALAYDLDRGLRKTYGDYGVSSKEFAQLTTTEKHEWLSGPDFSKKHPARGDVYLAVTAALEKYTLPMPK